MTIHKSDGNDVLNKTAEDRSDFYPAYCKINVDQPTLTTECNVTGKLYKHCGVCGTLELI